MAGSIRAKPQASGTATNFMTPMFSRYILAVALTIVATAPSFAQGPAKDRLADGVERGLAFLALLQEKDGAWLANGTKHPAITSLAVMAFLSAGHVPGEGPYRDNLEKGVRWVLAQQRPDGIFSSTEWDEMYQHGICTLMLCEVAPMCDTKLAKEIRPKIEKAVKLILQGQRQEPAARGGWRYRLVGTDADISVSGWQILALRAARNLGCDVPAERIDIAMRFIHQCRDTRSGGFTYVPGSQVTLACTGTCVLALELAGKERHHARETLQAGSYLLKNPLGPNEPHFHYTVYYCSQAMFQLGNNYWHIYRPRCTHCFWTASSATAAGSSTIASAAPTPPRCRFSRLTVEYRLLPIYQRNEDSDPASRAP